MRTIFTAAIMCGFAHAAVAKGPFHEETLTEDRIVLGVTIPAGSQISYLDGEQNTDVSVRSMRAIEICGIAFSSVQLQQRCDQTSATGAPLDGKWRRLASSVTLACNPDHSNAKLLSLTPAAVHGFGGITVPAGANVLLSQDWDLCAKSNNVSLAPGQGPPRRFDRPALVFLDDGVVMHVDGLSVGSEIHFHDNGRLASARVLARPTQIGRFRCSTRTDRSWVEANLELFADGSLERCWLAGPHRMGTWSVTGELLLWPDGTPRMITSAVSQPIGSYSAVAGATICFDREGHQIAFPDECPGD
jgi:hypothetical protein